MKLRDTLKINDKGHLEIGGADTVELAGKFGTPLYVMDEEYIRKVCRGYVSVIDDNDALVCYASKAFSAKAIYRIVESEGLGTDVVSGGELYTAMSVNFPADKIFFHGNNKSKDELKMALEYGVHCIVVDNYNDIALLEELSQELKITGIGVQIRTNPGVEAHTHHYIQTTRPDSKFGFLLADGSALEAVKAVLKSKPLKFLGVHCHIGSQIFDTKPFLLAIDKLTDFLREILDVTGAVVTELNLGGGFGIHYTDEDAPLEPKEYVKNAIAALKSDIAAKGLTKPRLIFEPGRSIVGESGITLYTVGSTKEIKGYKKYLSIDGGMFDNPRYALYQAKYSAVLANRANDPSEETVTLAGKCCESGDIIISELEFPRADRGDIVAVFSTGAYNYSMASNYNRNPIPPVVLVRDGKADYIVKPQTYADIAARDCVPEHLK